MEIDIHDLINQLEGLNKISKKKKDLNGSIEDFLSKKFDRKKALGYTYQIYSEVNKITKDVDIIFKNGSTVFEIDMLNSDFMKIQMFFNRNEVKIETQTGLEKLTYTDLLQRLTIVNEMINLLKPNIGK